jgi:uncharacterized protein
VELQHRFTVPASVDDTWTTFMELGEVAGCFPGATVTSYDGQRFEGTCKVKLGPIALLYTGNGTFVERDDAAHRAVISASGKDKRGNGTAGATVTIALAEGGTGRTAVEVLTDLNVTGKPAQFGRGVMQDVSAKLMGRFADCLAGEMQSGAAATEGDPTIARPTAPNEAGPADSATTAAPGPTTGAAPTQVGGTEETEVGTLPTGPAGDAAEAVARAGQPAPAAPSAGTSPRARPSEDVLDLGEASREAVLKRVVPALAVLLAAILLVIGLRRR